MAGLLGPDGRPIRRDAPLLVDAYGRPVRAGAADALPPRPRLRPLEILPFREGDREGILMRDPSGVAEAPAVLRLEVLPLLQLLDGTRTADEICARVVTESGDPAHGEAVRRFLEDLDRLYLLESPRYEARRRQVREEYRRTTVRPHTLAGHSYPEERGELEKFLAGHYAEAEAIRASDRTAWPSDAPAVAIPHLDLRRSGPVVALGMLAVGESPPPDLVLLFGTGHALYESTFALTDKRLSTPLGELEADRESFELVLSQAGEDALAEEMAVRDEHSVEFLALHLSYRFRPVPRVVTAIFGGFHRFLLDGRSPESDALYRGAVEGLRAALARARQRGLRVLCLAGIDLSHVGARFGDPEPLDRERLDEVRRLDEEALAAAASGQARRWYDAVARHEDSTGICGYSALHALLDVAQPGPGRLLRYEQSPEPGGSAVTYASLAWPARGTP